MGRKVGAGDERERTKVMKSLRAMAAWWAMCASVTAVASGCGRSTIGDPLATEFDPADPVAKANFWHELPGRSAVSNNEGIHGVLSLVEDNAAPVTYEDRVRHLKELGWISEKFDEPADMAMRRGTLAEILAHALEIKGGVMMQLTDKHPRYATRELVYLGVMGDGTDNQVISGLDYVGVISKAQDYLTLKQMGRVDKVDRVRVPPVGAVKPMEELPSIEETPAVPGESEEAPEVQPPVPERPAQDVPPA